MGGMNCIVAPLSLQRLAESFRQSYTHRLWVTTAFVPVAGFRHPIGPQAVAMNTKGFAVPRLDPWLDAYEVRCTRSNGRWLDGTRLVNN